MELQHRLGCAFLTIVLTVGVIFAGTKEIKQPEESDNVSAWYSRSDTIYFWYNDETLTDYISKAAVDYGEQNNVHVLPMLVTLEDYLEAVNVASVYNDTMPDAFLLDHESLEMAYLAGLATEVSDTRGVLSSGDFSESALNSVTYDGKLVGYPFYYNTCALLYNKNYLRQWAKQKALAILKNEADDYVVSDYFATIDMVGEETSEDEWSDENPDEGIMDELFENDPDLVPYDELSEEEQAFVLEEKTDEVMETAIPTTWNELLNIADTFSASAQMDVIMSWDVSDIFYNYWMIGDVTNLGGPAGDERAKIFFNNDPTINRLKKYKYLHQFFSIKSDEVDYHDVVQDFIDGKMLFTIASTDVVDTLNKAKAEEELDFEYGFAMIPMVDSDTKCRPMSMTKVLVVNGYSEKKEIANGFAQYLVSDYASELYARTGKPSCNMTANAAVEGMEIFDKEYAQSVPLPKIIELENFWMELEALFARIWNDADVQTEIEALDNTVDLFFS